MKKTIVAFILAVTLCFSAFVENAFGQNTAPIDLILVLDTSTAMSSSYENVNNYLSGEFLSEFLHVGDTFHLITFAGSPRVDSARRIRSSGDVETIIGRMLIQYPVENGNNVSSALSFTEQYITSLPNREKKIVLVTLGNQAVSGLVLSAKQRLPSGSSIDYLQVTPGQRLTNLPGANRTSAVAAPVTPPATTPAASTAATPTTPATPPATTPAASSAPAASTAATPPAAPRPAAPPPATTPAATTPATTPAASTTAAAPAATTPASTTPAASTASPATTPSAPTTASPAAATPASTTPAASPAATTLQSASETAGITTRTQDEAAAPSLTEASALTDTNDETAAEEETVTASSDETTETDTSDKTTAAESDKQETVAVSKTPAAVSGQESKSRPASANSAGSSKSFTSSLPFIIGIIILILLILGLIIFLLSRRLNSSPNRVMTSSSTAKTESSGGGSSNLADFAAGQTRQRTTPYDDRITKDDVKSAVINPTGPLLLNLFVNDQNTSIGKRNIHSLKSGYSLTVGGGKSDDYFIFLVPIPAKLGEIRRDGSQLTFIPHKAKYFPDIGSNQVKDCINKTIRIISDKNYEMRFRFEMYEDPLIALNRLLHSVKVPG